MIRALWLGIAICSTWPSPAGRAAEAAEFREARYALVVGANEGASEEAPLLYAARDAVRMGQILQDVGGFLAENVVVIEQPSMARVRDSLRRLNQRIRTEVEAPRRSVLLVFFSGHGDRESLHLGRERLGWDELRETVVASPADVRLLFVDACRSGATTRVKGVKPISPFALPPEQEGMPEGFVIFSSAAEGEDAQESDELQASFFTHHLLSALQGAADSDGDGRISVSEAYAYTSERTVASTAGKGAEVQHPTFRYELKGRADLALAAPVNRHQAVQLTLHRDGRYILFADGREGRVIAEAVVRNRPRRLWLRPGAYFVQIRNAGQMREGMVAAKAGAHLDVTGQGFATVRYAQLARKGLAPSSVYALSLLAGLGRSLLDYEAGPTGKLVFSTELQALTVDALASYGHGSAPEATVAGGTTDLFELGLRVGARKVIDWGRLSISAGARVGMSWATQAFASAAEAHRRRLLPVFGAVARADLVVTKACFLAAEGELLASSTATIGGAGNKQTHVDLRPVMGGGIGCFW